MSFVLLSAGAPQGAQNALGNYGMIIMLVLMGVAMYFLMYRPQKKKEKQQADLRNSIEIGDEITTIGGIVGRVVSIKEDTFVLETAGDRSRMRFKRWAIQEVGKLSLDSDGGEVAEKGSKASKEKAGKAEK